jgi:hypothetical protein
MAHLIELSGIKKSYQLGMTEVVALRGVDLTSSTSASSPS